MSNPEKRSLYDQHGEEGLKEMSSWDSKSSRSAGDIFEEFFGSSVFEFDNMFKSNGPRTYDNKFKGFNDASSNAPTPMKPPPVENKLPCSLEELYNGSTRKMKISRTVVDANGYEYMTFMFNYLRNQVSTKTEQE